jgi:ATP-dependent Zn protease
MTKKAKVVIVSAVLICLAAAILWIAAGSARGMTKLTYSQFLEHVRSGQVASVLVIGSNSGAVHATGRLKDGNTAVTVLPADYRDAMLAMQDQHVNVEIRDTSFAPLRLLLNATPFLLLLGVWVFLIRRIPQGPRNGFLG